MPGSARVGDFANCPLDSHGCPGCPHNVTGKIIEGSDNVFINGKRAPYLGCKGIHKACCGPNIFYIDDGAPTVFINGHPAARIGDRTSHCGGSGEIKTGSGNVIIGNGQNRLFAKAAKSNAPFVENIAANRKRDNEIWQQNMEYLDEKGVLGEFHRSKVPENFLRRSKRRLKNYLDERGTQKYSEGHYVAAYLDAIGSSMLDDVPETAGGAAASIAVDAAGGKVFKILGKGGKLLWKNLDTLSEPVRTRVTAILKKAESGKKLTSADNKVIAEAVGEVGGQKALNRQGITTDKNYVNRYHGPDHMGRDVDGNLVETEFKGSVNDSTQLPMNAQGQKQLSQENNLTRSRKMKGKAKKVEKASNRIGGPYTKDEIVLWEGILEQIGEKRLISTHTNIDTGDVKVIERDEQVEFWMENALKWVGKFNKQFSDKGIDKHQGINTALAGEYLYLGLAKYLHSESLKEVVQNFCQSAECIETSFRMAYDESHPKYLGERADLVWISMTCAIDGFHAALLAGDFEIGRRLALWAQIPSDEIDKAGNPKHSQSLVANYMHALKYIFLGDDAKALEYAWATEKWFQKKGVPTKNRFHRNFFHRCRMVRAILEKDPGKFEASMEVQLKSHAWAAVHDDIADTPEAYIYVDGVALCNLAIHKGMKINFEAGVIPEGLLIGA